MPSCALLFLPARPAGPQEEPKNMGAYLHIQPRLQRCMEVRPAALCMLYMLRCACCACCTGVPEPSALCCASADLPTC